MGCATRNRNRRCVCTCAGGDTAFQHAECSKAEKPNVSGCSAKNWLHTYSMDNILFTVRYKIFKASALFVKLQARTSLLQRFSSFRWWRTRGICHADGEQNRATRCGQLYQRLLIDSKKTAYNFPLIAVSKCSRLRRIYEWILTQKSDRPFDPGRSVRAISNAGEFTESGQSSSKEC